MRVFGFICLASAFVITSSASGAQIKNRAAVMKAGAHEASCSLLFDKGDMDGAIKDCTRAIKINPKSVDAYHTRAVAYLSQRKYDLAIADCNKLLVLKPERAGTFVLRGMAYSRKGDYDRAIVDFTLSLQLRPGFGMAQSGLRDARSAKARVAAGQKPGDPRAWCDGNALPGEGFPHDAQIKGCTTLIESGKETPGNLARDYFNRGSAHNFEMHYDLAAADYTEAIRLKPDYAEAWSRRGSIAWVRADYDSAIADLTNAIKYDPCGLLNFDYRGKSYAARGQFDSAIADFERVLNLDSENAEAHLSLCRARVGKGELDRAIADCDSAIKLSRTSEATEGWNGRGDAHFLKGDFTAAVVDYDKALDLWPQYPEALYGRGAAKSRSGDLAGGKADMDSARKLKPEIEAAEAKLAIKP